MSGDYSRKTYDAHDNFSGVRMQQGRVQLDADWNEQGDIQDRRWRAETVDVIGRCGCPDETPDAFRIENSGGTLSIGIGRTYVDGLLAENHGLPPLEFDRILAEERGTMPVLFDMQPYLPDANDTLPTVPGPALVYLDVWHREVTYLEDPSLVEKAVGVDTTARQQTVWQVRVLGGVGAIDCATPDDAIPGWPAIITPSGGRLSSQGIGVSDPMDPCLIPPSGGYRGLDNRLYRLEIHAPAGVDADGTAVPATFKWSRYNATIATAVTALPELDTLRVERTGRDDVLRFNAGDWVEVTDDHLELNGEPGIIRRVDSVDDGTRTIVLRDDLPAGLFPTDAQDLTTPGRHTRVRRWDQSGVVRDTDGNLLADLDDPLSPGVIPVPADGTSVVLEDGVQVTFDSDPTGGPVRSGDFWCFATRAADASVEELDFAPPEDIHHHFCRLAVAEFDGEQFTGTPTDCRHCFPPLTELDSGCCTEVVQVGESIQAALDSLPAEGGCVCVKTGLHVISEPLRIEGSNVVLHGESPGARIRREDGVAVLRITNPNGAPLTDVKVEGLRLEAGGSGTDNEQIIVFVDRCNRLHLADCTIGPDEFSPLIAVRLGSVLGGRVEHCVIGPVSFGVFVDTDSTDLDILDNDIGSSFFDGVDGGTFGIWLEDAFGPSRIERNRVTHFVSGIYVNSAGFAEVPSSGATGTRVIDNIVARSSQVGGGGLHVFGIDVASRSSTVAGNRVSYRSAAYGGIRLTGADGCVENNQLFSTFRAAADAPEIPLGIQLGFLGEEAILAAADGVVRGNRLRGFQDAIVAVETVGARIADNEIDSPEVGLRNAIQLANSSGSRVEGNRARGALIGVLATDGEDNRVAGNTLLDGFAGVGGSGETDLVLANNRIENMSGPGVLLGSLLGATAITGNRIVSCGFDSFTFGIIVLFAFGEVRVLANEVLNTGVSLDETRVEQPAVGLMLLLVLEALVEGNLVSQTNFGLPNRDFNAEDRALAAHGLMDFRVTDNIVLGFPIQIVDNNFIGPGRTHLVELRQMQINDNLFFRFERVTFSDNHCWHWVGEQNREDLATVRLVGRRAIVMGNHVKATAFRPAFDFNNMTGTYIGNDTEGRRTIRFNQFPTPEANFNR
jgi:parallel beta-helix repeat protein